MTEIETEELFGLVAFIAGCVVLFTIVLEDIWGDSFYEWLAKRNAESLRKFEEERRKGRK